MANFVNQRQSATTRRIKFDWLRLNGLGCKQARQMRDWTISHINQYLNANRETLVNARRTHQYYASFPQKGGNEGENNHEQEL